MERALASERVKSVNESTVEEELRAKEEECEALREALELVRDEGLIPSGGASSRSSGAHKAGQHEKEANNLHVSQLMGAQASLEGRLKEREREVLDPRPPKKCQLISKISLFLLPLSSSVRGIFLACTLSRLFLHRRLTWIGFSCGFVCVFWLQIVDFSPDARVCPYHRILCRS